MEDYYQKVKNYILDLEYTIVTESPDDQILIISNEEEGINNLVIACADPMLIMEQFLVELHAPTIKILEELLKKNRDIIHGALVLDETGRKVIFRDTLQIENLDLNELEGSINSLSLLLSEYSSQIIQFSKN